MNDKELETMRKSFQTVFDRKKQILNSPKIKKLQDKVLAIRKKSIDNNKDLFEIAKESFKNNDIDYFFAKDSKEANEIIFNVIKEETSKIDFVEDIESKIIIAKSKSNTLGEIAISKFLKSHNIDVVETDLGDRILQLKGTDNKPTHPTGPASHLNVQQIAEIVNKAMNVEVEPNPKAIMKVIRKDVLEKLAKCEVGISGANSIACEDGSIVLIHNEGNISLISNMKTHIVVAGIDKLVSSIEEAVAIAKLETVYATGNLTTSYMNVVSGPSKTADIEKKLIKNMYGAKRVVLIILDNGRDLAIDECLHCIGCGSCVLTCPVYNAVGNEFGFNNYLGGRGVAMSSFIEDEKTSVDSGLFMCTLCGQCTLNCPVAIPTNKLIEKIRSSSQDKGFHLKAHKNIKNNIEDNDSPYSSQ